MGVRVEARLAGVGVGVCRYRYNGKELNEDLGLYNYGARWYDPAVARWASIDPLAESMSNWSPFNYVFNNPITYIDPFGLSPYTYNWTTKQYEDEDGNIVDWSVVLSSINDDNNGIEATVVNEAGVSARKLSSILTHTSDIYQREGFSAELFKYKVLNKEEGKEISSTEGLFIAIVNTAMHPIYGRRQAGFSDMASNGKTFAWGGGAYASYVNINNVNGRGSSTYQIGYAIAHEFLHQLAYKADYFINGVNPLRSGLSNRYNTPLNLNSRGTYPGLDSELLKGPGNAAENILDVHYYLIERYLRLSN